MEVDGVATELTKLTRLGHLHTTKLNASSLCEGGGGKKERVEGGKSKENQAKEKGGAGPEKRRRKARVVEEVKERNLKEHKVRSETVGIARLITREHNVASEETHLR